MSTKQYNIFAANGSTNETKAKLALGITNPSLSASALMSSFARQYDTPQVFAAFGDSSPAGNRYGIICGDDFLSGSEYLSNFLSTAMETTMSPPVVTRFSATSDLGGYNRYIAATGVTVPAASDVTLDEQAHAGDCTFPNHSTSLVDWLPSTADRSAWKSTVAALIGKIEAMFAPATGEAQVPYLIVMRQSNETLDVISETFPKAGMMFDAVLANWNLLSGNATPSAQFDVVEAIDGSTTETGNPEGWF